MIKDPSSQQESDISFVISKWKVPKNTKISDFFVVPVSTCDIIIENELIDKCELFRKHGIMPNEIGQQLIMTDGGKLLDFKYKLPLHTWILLLENLLLGVSIIKNNGYSHLDIKQLNTLYSNTYNKLRIIDFGLSHKLTDIYNKEILYQRTNPYLSYPLEFCIEKIMLNTTSKDTNLYNLLFKYYNMYITAFDADLIPNVFNYYYTPIEINKIILKLFNFLKTFTDEQIMDSLKSNAQKIDVYSLGTVCVEMHKDINFNNTDPKLVKKYKQFVRYLLTIDYRFRPTIEEALVKYNKLKEYIVKQNFNLNLNINKYLN